jgi:hypothetical protein
MLPHSCYTCTVLVQILQNVYKKKSSLTYFLDENMACSSIINTDHRIYDMACTHQQLPLKD